MNRLFNLLPFHAGEETVASFASRLSAACGYRHPRSFGADLGFDFQALAVGNETAVATFASLLDRRKEDLLSGVVRSSDDRMNTLRGESLTRKLVQRQRLRFCPHCVREDEVRREGRRGFRAFGRLEWLVTAVRVCSDHGTSLITCDHLPVPMFAHDFVTNLAEEAGRMGGHLASAYEMPVDALQLYVEARLRGRERLDNWLDRLPLYVVVRVAEAVGAMDRHGVSFKQSGIGEVEWSACAGHGYEILANRDGFVGFLRSRTRSFHERSGDAGGRAVFGRLYENLAHDTADSAFDPIRDIIKDVAMCTLPLGPGDDFFGPVSERRLHSVQSASREFDIHPKRLRKLLLNSGVIDVPTAAGTYERIVVDAATMESFCTEAKATLGVPEAKERLGLTRIWFEELVSGGELSPIGKASDAVETSIEVERRFAVANVYGLLSRLQSVVTADFAEGMSDISSVARQANCTFREILDLLLGGSLKLVATASSPATFDAIRLDPEELKSRTRLQDHGCLNLQTVSRELPASTSIVKALVIEGYLPSKQVRNPEKRAMQTVVEPEVLEAFKSEYAALGNLATKLGTRTWSLKREFEEAGIYPLFEAAGAPYYRRCDTSRLQRK